MVQLLVGMENSKRVFLRGAVIAQDEVQLIDKICAAAAIGLPFLSAGL